jgi:hypothetical protein
MYQYFVRRKNRNKFELSNTKLGLGYNKIIITKPKSGVFNNPIIKLVSNNLKTVVEYSIIDSLSVVVEFNIDSSKDYKLIVKDGLKTQVFDLEYISNVINKKEFSYSIEEFYKKGKIFLSLKSETETKEDLNISFSGDLEKNIVWKKGTKEVNVNFVKQVIGYKVLKFNINGNSYTKTIINSELFPKNLVKTKDGIRLNSYCQHDLVLKTDLQEYLIKSGETNISLNLDLDSISYLKLYFQDKLLFEQKLTKSKFLPLVTIVDSPLRLKLNQPYYEDVIIKLKEFDNKFVIPQGETSIQIPYKKGIRKFTIDSVENCKFNSREYTFILK